MQAESSQLAGLFDLLTPRVSRRPTWSVRGIAQGQVTRPKILCLWHLPCVLGRLILMVCEYRSGSALGRVPTGYSKCSPRR